MKLVLKNDINLTCAQNHCQSKPVKYHSKYSVPNKSQKYFPIQKHSHHDEHFGIFDNQNRHLSPNVLDLFLGTIKNVIGSQQHSKNVKHRHSKNETNKGIDIALDSNTHIIPSLGNKQDLKFIFLGMYCKLWTINETLLLNH